MKKTRAKDAQKEKQRGK